MLKFDSYCKNCVYSFEYLSLQDKIYKIFSCEEAEVGSTSLTFKDVIKPLKKPIETYCLRLPTFQDTAQLVAICKLRNLRAIWYE